MSIQGQGGRGLDGWRCRLAARDEIPYLPLTSTRFEEWRTAMLRDDYPAVDLLDGDRQR